MRGRLPKRGLDTVTERTDQFLQVLGRHSQWKIIGVQDRLLEMWVSPVPRASWFQWHGTCLEKSMVGVNGGDGGK